MRAGTNIKVQFASESIRPGTISRDCRAVSLNDVPMIRAVRGSVDKPILEGVET